MWADFREFSISEPVPAPHQVLGRLPDKVSAVAGISVPYTPGGLRGPFNRYRAQDIDSRESGSLPNAVVTQPSFFIAGEKDPVRSFLPGIDLYATPGAACSDFRGSVILPGIGHWVQQEAPADTNAALETFLDGL